MNSDKNQTSNATQSELGQHTHYDSSYNPSRLFVIGRAPKRAEIQLNPAQTPFYGFDCWNHYEVSWLNPKGKPIVALAVISYDCHSPFIVESKSLKLYFNSFNNHAFKDANEVAQTIKKDLSFCLQTEISITLTPLSELPLQIWSNTFEGICLDTQDIECTEYLVNSSTLKTSNEEVEECLYSDLLKSNCLVTNQPDWGSVQIAYRGKKINHEGLLRYIISFRNHNEFHEQCIERIFIDIMTQCQPTSLTVYGRYTRRGGLDINPYRSTNPESLAHENIRLIRQ